MSIPVSIDPMGTLGANPLAGYVTNGLIFCIDMLAAGDGDAVTVRELVSGKAINGTVQINGGVTRSPLDVSRSDFDIEQSLYGRTQEIVAASPASKRNDIGFCSIQEYSSGKYPVIGTRYGREFFATRVSTASADYLSLESNRLGTLCAYYTSGVDSAKLYFDGIKKVANFNWDGAVILDNLIVKSTEFLAAVRVYDRVLTDDEILQNATMDALRWDKSIVY